MDRFHRRSHGLGIRLRPAKVAGEPVKKLFDLFAFDGAFDGLVLPLVLLWIGRIRIVCGHGNLIADIVGEFAR
jgi:Na+-translocating ferredoxin:NAD+ oxidoreductase RnfE subunit